MQYDFDGSKGFKYEFWFWLQYSYVCNMFSLKCTHFQQQSLIQASWKWSLDSSNASKWCIVWMRNWKNWTKESWSEDVGDIHLGSTHIIYIYTRIYRYTVYTWKYFRSCSFQTCQKHISTSTRKTLPSSTNTKLLLEWFKHQPRRSLLNIAWFKGRFF